MKSIIVIIPYFGKFPSVFYYWWQSALNNPSIDFLLITDNDTIQSESNIYTVHMSFEECRQKIQRCFDFSISLPTPYLLCNYKPAYGYIFEEYITKYDFWGYGDIDLIYGDLRHFITEEILSNYCLISGWGHLTLYKNNQYWRDFFMTKVNGYLYYKDVFTIGQLARFDEYLNKGIGDLAKHLHPNTVWDTKPFDDVCIPAIHLEFFSVFHPELSNYLIFEYDNKQLKRVFLNDGVIMKEPIAYAHFQRRSNLRIRTTNKNKYLVIPNSIIDYQNIDEKTIKKWGRPRSIENIVRKATNRLLRNIGVSFQFMGGY